MFWLEQFVQDLRYAWRGLWRSRAFVATTVLTLAVGLGLVTVVFAVFNAYVLRPFAVRDPYSLHEIRWRSQDAAGGSFTWSEYQELRGRRDLFDDVIAERSRLVSSSGSNLTAAFVSGNYFETLGARVLLGRALADFDASGQPIVLSHPAWTRLFNSDPAVLGRELVINGQAAVIVGVMRPEFSGLDESPRDLWAPLTMHSVVARELSITARLRPGVTAERTQAALTPFMAQVFDKSIAVRAEVRLKATPNPFSWELLSLLSPIFAAFGLVLVAACTNVSNVMLARANARYRELGLRRFQSARAAAAWCGSC